MTEAEYYELLGLYEWQSPEDPGRWEIISGDEHGRRVRQLRTGERPGPVSYACPPGALSGMSEAEAMAQAREAGLL